MTKRPPPGKCVYCLKHSDNLTWDHVFPQAWYPITSPLNRERWKIPACLPCNSEYGKIEEDLLWRLGLTVDPEDVRSLGITDKVLRATNPRYAKSERDRKYRAAKRESILKQLTKYSSEPIDGILPNFGPQPNLQYEGFGVILVSENSLVRLGQKIVRGVTYLVDNSFIDDRYWIDVYFIQDHEAQEVVSMIEAHGTIHDRGPGIVVKTAKASQDITASLWLIEIWGKLKMYAVVAPIQDQVLRPSLKPRDSVA